MPGRLSRRGFLIGTSGVAFTLAAAACGGDDGASGSTSGPTVRDEFGATIVPADPRRVVSVGHNDHDTLLALGVVPVGVFDWYGDQPDATWPWAHDLLDGSTPAIVGTAGSGIDTEAVASVDPDLIIGTYSGMTQGEHDKLSAIAPTVAQPAEYADFGVPWQIQTRTIGKAVGRSPQADGLVSTVQRRFTAVADANPAFRGRTVIVGALKGAGQFGVFGPEDPKVRFFTELGFVNPPVTQQITGTNFAPISTEQLGLADADLLVWYAGGGFGDKLRAELAGTPVYGQLSAVKEGRVVILDDDAADAMAWSTVLSLPYALEQIPPRIAPLLNG
ncbi:iron-siderophore ABC transporter substrate-binding protein [Rhodococcus sp. Q]|uniref:iron-siderophore ABC transporter substrate-binding protein n=1 Tax=Rhodococcus sp. Q TaxID=2502252 RepID=UPI0010F82978|nr:iron-siderophore ABC transporter substrate-binding protein [Rhodococcus sp. Q]